MYSIIMCSINQQKIDSELVKRALGNAIGRSGTKKGMIFHSDRGCQYSSKVELTFNTKDFHYLFLD